jgi:hypothetical protein
MATRVVIREFAGSDHTAAVREVAAEMFDLPEVGSRYWRGGLPYTVRGIAEGDPAVVDLVVDRARSQEVDQLLPAGWAIDVGRDRTTGRWSAVLFVKGEILRGSPIYGRDGDDALERALGERRPHEG